LHGDRNGIVVIPPHLAAATADGCPELMAAESVVLDYLKAGTPTAAGYAAARAECHAQIKALSLRLKSLVGPTR
jgi:regulator of RNase E activity RraA